MKTKNACILLLATLALTACEYDDSALWEQVNQNTERIAALEAWQAETNTNIQSLQTLLNTTDYITAVTPVMENGVEVGYTISFLNSDPITIYHGQKGDKGDKGDKGATPQIGVTQGEDGNWYWTLNGELLTDANGNSIRANGEKGDQGDKGDTGATGPAGTSAPVPQLSTGSNLTTQGVAQDAEGTDIVADAIYLSVDGGNTWYRVSGEDGEQGDKGDTGATGATGDSFFSDVEVTDEAVIFTLADGTTFSVPRYTGIKLTFDTEAVHLSYGGTQTVKFTAEGSDQFTTDNLFIIAPDGWKAEVTLPTSAATEFILTATEFILTVTAPTDATSGAAEGEILMMLDNQQGNTTIGRIKVDCKSTNLVMNNVTAGALATAIGDRTNLTSITVTSGTLNETDWAAVRKNYTALLYLDLEGAIYEGTDKDILAYSYNGVGSLPLLTIQLPQGVTGLGGYAFYGCDALTSITLPEGVTTIGSFAFASCKVLTSIDLPDGLESIGNSAFNNCTSLKSITLPEGVTSIGTYAFNKCTSLESIDLPDGLESIGDYAFLGCTSLESIDLPAGVTSIGTSAFSSCTALTTVTCQATEVPDLGNYVFVNTPSLANIYVPAGSVDDYKAAANWSAYSTKIQAIQ